MDIIKRLPYDLREKVATFLDIDTRRILGIYKRITPEPFSTLYNKVPRIQKGAWWHVSLGPVMNIPFQAPLYSISKHFGTQDTFTEVMHVNRENCKIEVYGNYTYNERYQHSDSSSFIIT